MTIRERFSLAVCFLCQVINSVEATRYPYALGAIIVSILLPGLVIFAVIFSAVFVCCYWRKIPFLRRRYSNPTAKPKPVPASAYPHQAPVQYTPASPGGDEPVGEDEVKIKMETSKTEEKEPMRPEDDESRYPQ